MNIHRVNPRRFGFREKFIDPSQPVQFNIQYFREHSVFIFVAGKVRYTTRFDGRWTCFCVNRAQCAGPRRPATDAPLEKSIWVQRDPRGCLRSRNDRVVARDLLSQRCIFRGDRVFARCPWSIRFPAYRGFDPFAPVSPAALSFARALSLHAYYKRVQRSK